MNYKKIMWKRWILLIFGCLYVLMAVLVKMGYWKVATEIDQTMLIYLLCGYMLLDVARRSNVGGKDETENED